MSFQDQPRRQRQPRYPALARYEDDDSSYQDGYQGFGGRAEAPRQRPPWDEPQQPSGWDTGAQQYPRDSGAQQAARGSGAQQAARSTGAHRVTRESGAQRTLRDSGAQPPVRNTGENGSLRNTGTQRPARDTGAQPSLWGAAGQPTERDTLRDTGWDLPRRTSGPFLAAADGGDGGPRDTGRGKPPRGRGPLLPGAIAGFLAAAAALGVANLVAAFVRPQASPIIAVGGAFIDRTPSALKNFAVEKFGENDKNMLLLGMYVTIALIAMAIGILAWRRVAIGVAGVGLFGLFGAFVAITRPESHVTDVIPSIVGGMAGIAAIIWLVQTGMPAARSAASRTRRR